MVIDSWFGSRAIHAASPSHNEIRSSRSRRSSYASARTVADTKVLPMLAASILDDGLMRVPASTSERPVATAPAVPSDRTYAAVAPGNPYSSRRASSSCWNKAVGSRLSPGSEWQPARNTASSKLPTHTVSCVVDGMRVNLACRLAVSISLIRVRSDDDCRFLRHTRPYVFITGDQPWIRVPQSDRTPTESSGWYAVPGE